MSERETKEITTPGGHVIVLNSYITGREKRALQFPYFKEAADFKPEILAEKGKAGAIFEETQNLALKTVIVSVDGQKDGDAIEGGTFSVVEFVLNLPSRESSFIVKAINDVTSDKEFEAEKKTS